MRNPHAHAEKVRMLAKALRARQKGKAVAFALEQAHESEGGNRATWLNVVDALNLDLAADRRIAELTEEASSPRETSMPIARRAIPATDSIDP